MIAQRVAVKPGVDNFITRHRWDFRPCLQWSDEEIEKALGKLAAVPPYWDKLRRSQKICVLIGAHMRKFAYYNDMGTGKTFVALSLAAYFRDTDNAKRFVVLVPNRVNCSGWLEQIGKHTPDLAAEVLPSSTEGKLKALEVGRSLIYIDTYAGWTSLCVDKRGTRWRIDGGRVAKLRDLVDGFILDESSAVGGWQSLQTKIAQAFAVNNNDLCLFLLSGTPFGRDPQLLWSQMKLLDDGYTLGETLALFRRTFCTGTTNYWGATEWAFQKKKTPLLHSFIAHQSVRVTLDDADLPAVNAIVTRLPMSEQGMEYYDSARATLAASRGDYELMQNTFIRMRTITSGFLHVLDEGEKRRLEFEDNPKLDWVLSQAPSLAEQKVVLFHDFNYSGTRLRTELQKLGIECGLINGEATTRDIARAYEGFTKGGLNWLLINSRAGAYGINLQAARYGIFYEAPVPVIIRKQCELRFIRPGSNHPTVTMIDLVVRESVDESILSFYAEGRDLFRAILDGTHKL